jgi:threonylcarbamoyladenosine tRNA methylthiotransferase MtaB
MNTVAFMTLGCKVNQYETEAITELFLSKAYKVLDYDELADIYIINTCTVTNLGDKKSRQAIRKAKRQNPDAIIVVVGCYAQTAPEEIAKIDGVSLIIGTKDRNKIVELVEEYRLEQGTVNKVEDIMKVHDFEEFGLKDMHGRTRAYLKIQDGCNQFCSYCIIPYARGPIRSRLPEDVIAEVKKLVDNGFKEVVLAGIHVASYGKDLENIDLLEITKRVHQVEGLERIRFSSVEPNVLTEEFLSGINNLPKVCDHMHLSLQSGCDETLKAMNRKYTTKQYYDAVQRLRKYMPNAAITTDVIVGFPGETDEDFNKTCEFVKTIGFSKIHVFPYSPKKGTVSAKRLDQVDAQIKDNRSKIMIELEQKMGIDFLINNKNKVIEVLFEQEVQKGIYEGYTTNYIKVFVGSEEPLKNQIKPVRISEIKNDYVKGEIIFA